MRGSGTCTRSCCERRPGLVLVDAGIGHLGRPPFDVAGRIEHELRRGRRRPGGRPPRRPHPPARRSRRRRVPARRRAAVPERGPPRAPGRLGVLRARRRSRGLRGWDAMLILEDAGMLDLVARGPRGRPGRPRGPHARAHARPPERDPARRTVHDAVHRRPAPPAASRSRTRSGRRTTTRTPRRRSASRVALLVAGPRRAVGRRGEPLRPTVRRRAPPDGDGQRWGSA